MASTTLHLPGSAAGQLVYVGGGFMPPRLLLVPVGARLPPGVHAVAAFPATAVVAAGGSGSRAIHVPRSAVTAPAVGSRLRPGVHAVAAATATAVVAPAGSGSRAINVLPRAAVLAPGRSGSCAINVLPCAAVPVPAPVGARLPPGVHAVAAFPTTAIAAPCGSGSRAINLFPRAGTGEPAADNWEWEWEGASAFYDVVDVEGLNAIWVLNETLQPAAKADGELAAKVKEVHSALSRAVGLAGQEHSNKMDIALLVIRGCYGMVKLAYKAYPSAGLAPLPEEQGFITMCLGLADDDRSPPAILGQAIAPLLAPLKGSKLLGPEVPAADADRIKSVCVAVAVSKAVARAVHASYVSRNPDI